MSDRLAHDAGSRSYGFAIWGLICLVISLVGFWPSYVAPLASGTYRSPSPMMTWHVISTAIWLVLIVVQPLLIQRRKVKLHRRLGILGVFIAAGVVITGIVLQVDVMGPYTAKGDFANAVMIPFIRLSLLLGFAVCIALAIALRRQPEYHKRLIVLGTFPLLQSAFDRMAANVFGLVEIRGFMPVFGHVALMILFAVWDRRRIGFLHPVTKWGTLSLILFYLLSPIVGLTEWWRELAANLAGKD